MLPEGKIRICENGPYLVTGNIPLFESMIIPKNGEYCLEVKREFPSAGQYNLCRCGKTKNPPFCDGAHIKGNFIGTETASRVKYEARAHLIEGSGLDLLDDRRCAFARFCHTNKGKVWELMADTDQEEYRLKAIKGASECLAGRLTAVKKTGELIEPEYDPAIEVIQDPEKRVSAGLFVKGCIIVESADGELYETRNRIMLCRCGKSKNKPFCDAAHVSARYLDK